MKEYDLELATNMTERDRFKEADQNINLGTYQKFVLFL